jgi:hypothetical protein
MRHHPHQHHLLAASGSTCHAHTLPWLAMVCLTTIAATGCSRHHEDKWSRARPPVFKTTGRVMWNGEPAAGAIVALNSLSHNLTASGMTDTNGEFVLTTWRQGDGATAGDHRVTIQTILISGWTADLSPIEVNTMPPIYEKPETSGLTATISDKGKNVLVLEVSGPRRGPAISVPFPGRNKGG